MVRILVATLVLATAAQAIDSREAAPRFSGKTSDGEKFSNETLKGKVVLLQFWTTWCKYCRADQPAVEAVDREFGKSGLVVMAVNLGESRRKVQQYLAASPRSSKIVMGEDTNLAAAFAATSYPLYIVIDRNGKIAGRQEGAGGESSLRTMLAKAGLLTE